jgi:predicted O-methyltransferase YrrM
VDPARFHAELPLLFEDFPHSEHPRGLRFDDVVAGVPNLAMENNLTLVNLAVSLLEPGESYVEAGTYMGASLIAAARENEGGDLVAIDNFSFGAFTIAGRSLPAASRSALEENLERFGVSGATILEGDALEVLRSDALSGRSVGVFYYDACHDYDAQLEALRLIEPFLADPALVIVDDADWERVGEAIRDYLAAQPRARLLLEIAGSTHGQPQWWEGMQVLAWGSAS